MSLWDTLSNLLHTFAGNGSTDQSTDGLFTEDQPPKTVNDPNSFVVYNGTDLPMRGEVKIVQQRMAEYGTNFGKGMIAALCPAFAVTEYRARGATRICFGEPDARMRTMKVLQIMRYTLTWEDSEDGTLKAVYNDGDMRVLECNKEGVSFSRALEEEYDMPQATQETTLVSFLGAFPLLAKTESTKWNSYCICEYKYNPEK